MTGYELEVVSGSSYYTLVEKSAAVVNVTVTGGANATPAWTVNGTPVNGVPATLTEGDTYSVVYTANTGYAFEPGATTNATGTAGTTDINITISDAIAVQYTITFTYGLDHSSSVTAQYAYGVTPTAPEVLIAVPGYEAAWPEFSPVTGEATYAAVYTLVTYTITYKDNEGNLFTAEDWADGYTAPTTFTVTAPATLPVAANIARDSVTFNGWTNSVGTTIAATTAGIYENLEVFADFTGLGPTYPSYIDTSDLTIKGQYDAWALANNVPAGANNYEADFLLNVAPGLVGATLEATAVSISGTTVTIDINHAVNGYPYIKKAATVAGLASATPIAIEITPADQVQGLDNGARITLTGESGTAQFYQIGVQSAPVAVPNN